MRRIALLGLTLLLPACQSYVGNPFDGFGGFIGDTHTFRLNPNRPVGDSPNMLRAEGKEVDQEPLTPEPGNVWPRPASPEPTLQDLERGQPQPDTGVQPAPQRPVTRGSSTPPGGPEALPPEPGFRPGPPPGPSSAAPPTTKFYPTPGGTSTGTGTGNGVQTFTSPSGGTGVVVPNGNGTSTLIGPDGSVTTVPTPR
jgi:hypothetical protein